MVALFAGNLGMKTLTTPILRRFGFRSVLIANGVLSALSIVACGFLTATMPRMLIAAILFLGGLCRSMQFTSLTTLAFADIPAEKMTRANTFLSTVTQMSMGMGVGVGAVVLHLSALLHGRAATALKVADFHLAFFLVGVHCPDGDCRLLQTRTRCRSHHQRPPEWSLVLRPATQFPLKNTSTKREPARRQPGVRSSFPSDSPAPATEPV